MGFNPQTFIDSRQQTESTDTSFDPDKFLSTRETDTPSFDPDKFLHDRIGPSFGTFKTLVEDPKQFAMDAVVETGNLGEMVLALPEIIGGAGGTILFEHGTTLRLLSSSVEDEKR